MKTFYTLLGCTLLLFSCQADLDLSDSEKLSTADAMTKGKNNASAEAMEGEESSSEDDGCETIFAGGDAENAWCFTDEGFSRWGWTIGPLAEAEESYSFELYAAAGQCDTSKGVLVGHLTVAYMDGTATVTYNMLEEFTLSEAHLYVGEEAYPKDKNGNPTVAPGQFPYKDVVAGEPYVIDGLESGEIWVIAHGVTCGIDADDNGDGNGEEGEDGEENDTDDGSGDETDGSNTPS